jgi:hypothetical protein
MVAHRVAVVAHRVANVLGVVPSAGPPQQPAVQLRHTRSFLGKVPLHDLQVAVHEFQVAVLRRRFFAKRRDQILRLPKRLGIFGFPGGVPSRARGRRVTLRGRAGFSR